MNLRSVFVPSWQLQERRPEATKKPVDAKLAAKAAPEPVASELSEQELALATKLAEDEKAELAVLKLNGEVARIGLRWLPGMEEKWNKQ